MDWDEVKDLLRGPAALQMPPFNEDLSLNLAILKKHIRHAADRGLARKRGFFICPSGTGEFISLTKEEHWQMVEVAVQATDGEVPVVAGTATSRIRDCIEMAENARRAGATAVMVPPPYYYKLDADAFFEWYRMLTEAVEIGVMIYDQGWRNLGAGVTLSMMDRLAELPNLIALKYGNPAHFTNMITAFKRHSKRFAFMDNSLGFTAPISHMHGAQGYIAGTASIWTEFELHRWDLLEAGKYEEAELFGSRWADFMRRYLTGDEFQGEYFFHDGATFKAMLEYAGLYGGPVRPPFRAFTKEEKEELFAELDKIDFEPFPRVYG